MTKCALRMVIAVMNVTAVATGATATTTTAICRPHNPLPIDRTLAMITTLEHAGQLDKNDRMTEPTSTEILLVDDETALREPLAGYLAKQGFTVTQAGSAAEARGRIAAANFDLVLLDIMMPGEDGLSLCRHLAETKRMPVIFITAKGEATDRIVGLEIGGDDYIVKPFDPRELVARIRSVLRRAGRIPVEAGEAVVYEFENWRLDPLKRRLIDPEGAVVSISSAEFRLLLAFLDHPRQVLDRDRLLDMVQGREAHLFDRAVDNQISRLRRKIEPDSRNPQLIQTVWGGGYMLAAEVRKTAALD